MDQSLYLKKKKIIKCGVWSKKCSRTFSQFVVVNFLEIYWDYQGNRKNTILKLLFRLKIYWSITTQT